MGSVHDTRTSTRINMAISYKVIHDLMLHEAAAQGDDCKLAFNITYVKRGKMDINYRDDDFGDRTALHCAAEEGAVM